MAVRPYPASRYPAITAKPGPLHPYNPSRPIPSFPRKRESTPRPIAKPGTTGVLDSGRRRNDGMGASHKRPPFRKRGVGGILYLYLHLHPAPKRQQPDAVRNGAAGGVLLGMRRGVKAARGNPPNPPFAKGGLFKACANAPAIPHSRRPRHSRQPHRHSRRRPPSFPHPRRHSRESGNPRPGLSAVRDRPGFWIPAGAGMTVGASALP